MRNRTGELFALLAYTIWGFLPLYWNLLGGIPAIELLAQRIFWSFILVGIILYLTKKITHLKDVINDRKTFRLIMWAAIVITVNWGIYIWAVTSGHIIETSMGYFIEPLFMVFLGMVFFKEKLNKRQFVALILAAVGVIFLIIQYGYVPWVALSLAFSFGIYGLLKKKIAINSLYSLGLESALIAPLALAVMVFNHYNGSGAFGTPGVSNLIIIGAGPATALPLLFFAEGARRIKLSSLGFIQYISPTISLFLGIFIYHETFTVIHLISFIFIWAGLLVYTISLIRRPEKKSVQRQPDSSSI